MAGNHAVFVADRASWVAANLDARLRRLAAEGFVVHVAAADDGGFAELSDDVIARPLPAGLAAWPGAFVLLQAHMIEYRPLLVHGFGEPWAWLAAFAARAVDAPAVFANVDTHRLDSAPQHRALELARVLGLPVESVWKRLYGILAQQVDRYVTSSHEEMELASEFVPGQKLEVALGGYGVDVQGLNPYDSELPAVGELRRQLGVPSTATHVVGLPADLPDRKRSSLANRLERRVPGAVCRTLGDAASDDVRHFFRALDVFVLPHDEPRWAQLAGACACPTVALNTRAHREIVVQGETGELADESSLIDATAALLADPGRLERYGVRARTRSVSRFDRRQVDDQLLRLYDGVLRGKMT